MSKLRGAAGGETLKGLLEQIQSIYHNISWYTLTPTLALASSYFWLEHISTKNVRNIFWKFIDVTYCY